MSYIPFGYFADFIGHLARNRERIATLTYRDLPWGDDWDYAGGYAAEAAAWKASLRDGTRDPRKAYVILQHDVDSVPERTMAALRVEEQLGIRSNVMIFNRRVDRRHYRETGELRTTDYIADFSYLQSLEAKGFVIGYHCNAYERSRFSRAQAGQVMLEDVEELSRRFSLDFMSAHGGPPGPDGQSNRSLELPAALRRRVRWVHNGHSIAIDGQYSDGGMNSGKRAAEQFDLRRFVRGLAPGKRYRVLIHPQYYVEDAEANPRLRSSWYEEALAAYAREPARNVWAHEGKGVLGRWLGRLAG